MNLGDRIKAFQDNVDKLREKDQHIPHHFKKSELIISLTVLVLAIGIGIFLIYDNRDYVQYLIDNPPPFADLPNQFDLDKIFTPGEIVEQEITPEVITEQLTENAFIITSDGTWNAKYLDGGNVPVEYFGEENSVIIFNCWNDFDQVKHFFGVFQIIDGTFLKVDLNIIGAYPSYTDQIGQGQSITWEGICP